MRRRKYLPLQAVTRLYRLRSLLGFVLGRSEGIWRQQLLVLDDTRYIACFEGLDFA